MHVRVKLLGLSSACLLAACGRTEPGSLSNDLVNATTLTPESDATEVVGTAPGVVPAPTTPVTPTNGPLDPTTTPVTPIPTTGTGPIPTPTGTATPPCSTGVRGAAEVPAFTFDDSYTTIDLSEAPGTSSWCVKGQAESAGADFLRWGAGLVLQVATADGQGNKVPVDLAQFGATALRFVVEAYGRPVRVLLTQVNDPNISSPIENFENNAFEWYGSRAPELTSGAYEPALSSFDLPDWTLVPYEYQSSFDTTRFNSIQFIVTNPPEGPFTDYSVCIHDLAFVDACGQPVLSLFQAEEGGTAPSPTTAPSSEPPQTTEPPLPTDEPTWDEPTAPPSTDAGSDTVTSDPASSNAGSSTTMDPETSAGSGDVTPAPAPVDAGSPNGASDGETLNP